MVLVKNPDYKGNEVAKNDGVTFKVYTKDEAAYADIQSGSLDVMESVPASATKTFKEGLHRTGLQQGRLRHPAVHHRPS